MAAKNKQLHKSHRLRTLVIIVLAIVLVVAGLVVYNTYKSNNFQSSIQPFYETSGLIQQGFLGEVLKKEPMGFGMQNGAATRILYRTQKADGSYTFSSGIIFVPNNIAASNVPLMVWAHGTIGLADECAPSRQQNSPFASSTSWVEPMLQKGWVVVATDYAGFGTPGVQGYLIGGSEAHDVLNSVRAAHNIVGPNLGKNYAIWGHSQGGHSALYSASLSTSYLPEYSLVGTAATAPATELSALFKQQYKSAAGWVIGPYVAATWPSFYSNLDLEPVLTTQGSRSYQSLANKCISAAALDGTIRAQFGQQFFSDNFWNSTAWTQAINQQVAPVLAPSQPLFVGESLTDQVVLPDTTALYIQKACAAGSNLNSLWLTDVGHIQLQSVIAPAVTNWVADRFAGRSNSSTCNQALPIVPAQ